MPEEIDYLFMGTPCNPFSPQRVKRYSNSSVKDHQLYKATFKEAFDMLLTFRPKSATMEQSLGFGLPEEAGGEVTPLRRLGLGFKKQSANSLPMYYTNSRCVWGPGRF